MIEAIYQQKKGKKKKNETVNILLPYTVEVQWSHSHSHIQGYCCLLGILSSMWLKLQISMVECNFQFIRCYITCQRCRHVRSFPSVFPLCVSFILKLKMISSWYCCFWSALPLPWIISPIDCKLLIIRQ